MYTVVEVDKTSRYSGTFTPYQPYVYSSIVTLSEGSLYSKCADYWTDDFGADGSYNDTKINVASIIINGIIPCEEVDTLNDCISTFESFYFDFDDQILYINFGLQSSPESGSVLSGIVYGYCSDTVRYFRKQLYRPIVKSIPSLDDNTDPLQYGIISFGGGSVVLVNDEGLFDKDEKLYGNEIRIKRGKEGDTYDQLILMFAGYIRDYTVTTSEFIIDCADKRERLQAEYPDRQIEVLDKYVQGEGWETRLETLPDGYGDVVQVLAYPVEDLSPDIKLVWCEHAESVDKVFVLDGEVLKPVTPESWGSNGEIVLKYVDAASDGLNPVNGLREVFVTGRMRNITNPADIISDLNDRVYGVDFNSSTYDVPEFLTERENLADVSLYMAEPKRLYEWIELLQNGSTVGFRYEDTLRRTIRCDLPDRAVTVDIEPIDIRNDDMPVKRNAELYASSCLVKYGLNHRLESYKSVENVDYEEQVVDEHRVKKVQEYESLLTTKADAELKAEIVMKDIHEVRPIVTLRVDSEKYPQPRIFDMVTARVSVLQQQASLPDLEVGVVIGDDIVIGWDEFVLGDIANPKSFIHVEAEREYLGKITGQVIGIEWLTDTNEVELAIRQRV